MNSTARKITEIINARIDELKKEYEVAIKNGQLAVAGMKSSRYSELRFLLEKINEGS